MKHFRVPAFTVIELVIALLLMSVVTGIAFTAWSLTNRRLVTFREQAKQAANYRLLHMAIRQDMEQADSILVEQGALSCHGTMKFVRYELLDSVIIREQDGAIVDSFHFAIDSVYLGFESKPQNIDPGKIDEIRLYLHSSSRHFIIQQYKVYDAASLF